MRLRHGRAARRARLSAVELHHAAAEQAHRRIWRVLENRLRYPLEVFAAMRAAWPSDRPMSVRISATDWAGEDGITPDDAVEIGEAFAREGADLIDVSAGQTWAEQQPVYGRMFQTPFSDKIRNEGGSRPWRSATSTSPTTPIRSSPPAAPTWSRSPGRI
jgi:hypothetical protein